MSKEDFRGVCWPLACILIFGYALWYAHSVLGVVAARAVWLFGIIGLLMAVLSLTLVLVSVFRRTAGLELKRFGTQNGDEVQEKNHSDGKGELSNAVLSAGWVVGLGAFTALIGILPSLLLFVLPFLRWRAGLPIYKAGLLTLALFGVLYFLDTVLELRIPQGVFALPAIL